MKLTIATAQFPSSADIDSNLRFVLAQMSQAADAGSDVIHFAECALSGYAGIEFEGFEGYDWAKLRSATEEVMKHAGQLGLWVVLGSSHPLTPPHKPHNSNYIINSEGQIADRYDKMFCAGDEACTIEDLAHYTPGDHFCLFDIKGVRCATIICHEYRYPELYREFKKRGAQVVFHSYHAGGMTPERHQMMENQVGEENFAHNSGTTLPEITMPATMISYAANNYLWISAANTSAPESCWGSFCVRPDGVIVGKLPKSKPGILFTEIDFSKEYYDSTRPWRGRAMNGQFHSGTLVSDLRSDERKKL